jgi:hypothetical protein
MQRGFWFVFLVVIMIAGSVWAINDKAPMRNLPVMGGGNEALSTGCSQDFSGPARNTFDATGQVYDMGRTWYDFQHNGSEGHMISVDDMGFVHVVWMNGQNSTNSTRHISYNVWDPSTQSASWPTGQQVDGTTRAGYATQVTLPSGWCFPAYHSYTNPADNSLPHSCAAMDYGPGAGIFNQTRPTPLADPPQLLWPKVAMGSDSVIHMVATESPISGLAGDPQKVAYSRGRPVWNTAGEGVRINWDNVDGNLQYKILDTVMTIAPDIAVDPANPQHIVIVMCHPRDVPIDSATQYNNDVIMYESMDGGNNWGSTINITNFAAADMDCASGDTVVCDRDTLRAYTDCSVLIDMNHTVHVAFTVCPYYSLEGLIGVIFTELFHWSSTTEEFSPILHCISDTLDWNATNRAGAWQRMAQRPCLAMDRTNGYLYCSFQRYDSIHTSAGGYPQGDAYMTMSRNCGRTWSQSINVTTATHTNSAAAGSCNSIRNITIAPFVEYAAGVGYIDMQYEDDLDAGACIQTPAEGVCTNNYMRYQRIPVDSIPPLPLADWTFPSLHVDSTGYIGRVIPLTDPTGIHPCPLTITGHDRNFTPESFHLYQNYPNPFNPTTNILFDLPRNARVSLHVYNVLGEAVGTLYDHQMLTAGSKTVSFDASNLASGVYLYRLDVDGVSAVRKMVLMK